MVSFVAWVGGIAASAQVATGIVRGVSQLLHGRPGVALLEVADGFAAPLVSACQEVSKLGHEIYTALASPWIGEVKAEPNEPSTTPSSKRCCQEELELLNGVAIPVKS